MQWVTLQGNLKFQGTKFFIVAVNVNAICCGGRHYFSFVCCTNVLKEIAQNKGNQCLCSKDIQKCETLMRNWLPIEKASYKLFYFLNLHSQSIYINYLILYFVSQNLFLFISVIFIMDLSWIIKCVRCLRYYSEQNKHGVCFHEMISKIIGVFQVFNKTIQSTMD